MIRINLLPFRAARKKENIRRQVFIFFSFLVLIALVMVYYNMMLGNQIADLTAKVDTTRTQLIATEKKAKQVDQIKKQITMLEKKMEIIQTLEVNRKEPVVFLENISSMVVEKRMWLTNLSSGNESVSITGIALDNKTVADFMSRLEGLGIYSSVDLISISHIKKKDISLKQFDITCVKKKDEEEKK